MNGRHSVANTTPHTWAEQYGDSRPWLRKRQYGRTMRTSFVNVRVFDGTSDALTEPTTVTVNGQFIESVGETAADGERIDAAGHTLMPGLIDAHWHSILAGVSMMEVATSDQRYI